MFDRENGANICQLYINGEELEQLLAQNFGIDKWMEKF